MAAGGRDRRLFICKFHISVLALTLLISCCIRNAHGAGTQLGPCRYQYENGDVVDLTELGSSNNRPRWSDLLLSNDHGYDVDRFSYNPCYPFSIAETECQDVAVCKQTLAGAFNIGLAETATFEENGDTLYLIYTSHASVTSSPLLPMRMTKVELVCDEAVNQDASFEESDGKTDIYEISLSSKCCCKNGCTSSKINPPEADVMGEDLIEATMIDATIATVGTLATDPTVGLHTLGTNLPTDKTAATVATPTPPVITMATHHTAGTLPPTMATHHTAGTVPPNPPKKLSAGSVLCIIFVCVAASYLIFGALYMKLYVGASGKEVVPNFGFWVDLPNLVLDGIMFLFTPCTQKSKSTYEDI